MFNLGFSELLLLGLIALIFIGPNQLPEVARTLGRLLNEWKRATSDFQNTMTTQFTDEVHHRRSESAQEPEVELPAGAHPVSEPEKKHES